MTGEFRDADGLRLLVVGASSGIGRAVAQNAAARGAKVAVAARRTELLTELAAEIGGGSFDLDVEETAAINRVVPAAVEALGGLDAVVFTSTVVPFAHIEDTEAATWMHAYTVNTIGASNVLRAAREHLGEDGVVLVASSQMVGRPRAGVAAYDASKAALDEILRAWRNEHPDLAVIRVGVGPTEGTEILRGADRELLDELFVQWTANGQLPKKMSELDDVAATLVSLVTMARANSSVVPESVQLAPRIPRGMLKD